MLSPPIPPGGMSTDADPATFRSVLGVGERLSIHIDAMREEAAPGVAAGKGSASSASAIQIMIRHLGPTVDVGSSAVPPSGDRSRLSSPINGRRGAISRSDSESSSSSGEGGDQTRRKKKLRAEMQGVFEILVLVMAVVVPISLMVYTLLPDGNPSAHRNAWVALGIVVSLVTIGAIIARLAATEAAAEVSSAIGVVASIVLIIISEMVLAEVLPYEFWSRFWGSTISACLLIGTIYAWTECAQRPKFLRSCIRGSPSCFHSCMMGIIGFCDKWLL